MSRADLTRALVGLLGSEAVVSTLEERRTYECDGFAGHRVIPSVVVLPDSAEAVRQVVRLCHDQRVPFVARGSGTGFRAAHCPWPTASSSS